MNLVALRTDFTIVHNSVSCGLACVFVCQTALNHTYMYVHVGRSSKDTTVSVLTS